MAAVIQVAVFEHDRLVYSRDFGVAVELGRQTDSQEELYSSRQLQAGCWRAVIARLDEDNLSRKHLRLEPAGEGYVRATNLSAKVPVRLPEGGELAAAATREFALPTTLLIGAKMVTVSTPGRRDTLLRTLPAAPSLPAQLSMTTTRFPTLEHSDSVEMEALVRWLQTTMGVLQAAANSSDFFQKAAQAVVDIVGLDFGRVLVYEQGAWRQAAVWAAAHLKPDPRWRPSANVLQQVLKEKRTFWEGPDQTRQALPDSLVGVEVVVASPVLDRQGGVIGALYGERRRDGADVGRKLLSKLEAMLVELLAGGVATGLARIEQEKAAVEADVRFGQFFTPELSRQLHLQPDLLQGRDEEVSLLFCDIRAFSRISERLGPGGTVEWLSDVMGVLSDCVLAHRGVLVDYIGDELLAMWGAPEKQPDHARLACLAALDILSILPALNARWAARMGEPLAVGIGVNTGTSRVGNTGSRHKFKYGPLGPAVNLASRVQGATKYLRTPLLITEMTRAQLDGGFATRRLCRVRVVNIARAVDLFELAPADQPTWLEVRQRYEQALRDFEGGNFRDASRVLGHLLADHPDDGPSLVLTARAINGLVAPDLQDFDPVWELPGK
jgi:adenylate cyclase